MQELHRLKERLCKELNEYGSRDRLDVGSLDVIDKLAHTIKNLDKIIEKSEMSGYSGRTMRATYSYGMDNGYSGRSYPDAHMPYSGNRYSYGTNGTLVDELRRLMNEAPDERTKSEFREFIAKMEMKM